MSLTREVVPFRLTSLKTTRKYLTAVKKVGEGNVATDIPGKRLSRVAVTGISWRGTSRLCGDDCGFD